MIEDEFSSDKAFQIDEKVWRILPKIQARKVKELLGIEGVGLADFLQAISVKLEAEEYDYEDDEEEENAIKTYWGVDLAQRSPPKIARIKTTAQRNPRQTTTTDAYREMFPETFTLYTSLYFKEPDDSWNILYSYEDQPVMIEKTIAPAH